jgi:hypothetical protein
VMMFISARLPWHFIISHNEQLPTPRDHLVACCYQRKPGEFVTPKPAEFEDWIIKVLLPRPADKIFCDVFAGSGALSKVADGYGCKVISVDHIKATDKGISLIN